MVLTLLLALLAACSENGGAQLEEQVGKTVDDLVPRVERAVGLPFKEPPRVAVRTLEQVRAYLRHKLDEEMPPARLHGLTQAYRLFGMLPDTIDLRALLVALYTEQVVGYYDPDSATLYIVAGADPAVLKLTLAHELVHALQGQHLMLDSLLAPDRDRDLRMAAQAVLEGQATVAALMVLMPDRGIADLPEFGTYRRAIKEQHAQMPVFSSAPLIIQESLVFPYLEGADFVRWFLGEHGDTVPFGRRMPRSTEQVLHPDRYRENDEPVLLALVGTEPPVYSDGLGEFETRVLLATLIGVESTARAGAVAWGGDRYAVYDAGDGQYGLVWWTAWDSPRAADRFATLLQREWPIRGSGDRRVVIQREPVGGLPGVRLVDAPKGWSGWSAMPRVRRLGG